MSRNTIFTHIIRREDGPTTAAWAGHVLHSAFQPIFGFHDGKLNIDAFEGLLRPFRFNEPVSPPEFFASVPTADRLAVETLTRTMHLINAGQYLDPATLFFVNFDPSVFGSKAVTQQVLREMRLILHEAKIDTSRIVCEVTEKKATSPQALTNFVSALRDHGYRIAVDDYGAEESDMARVSALRPDIVKFDAQWISRLMDTRPGVALLTLMVQEFAGKGIRTVFEGIEETWQLEVAEETGAHMVQGFALARPEIAPSSFAVTNLDHVVAAPTIAAVGQLVSHADSELDETAIPAPRSRRASNSPRPFGRRSGS